MSDALQDFLYSQEGNLTAAIPSCSLMDITMPMLPRTPLPTTCRVKTPKIHQQLKILKRSHEKSDKKKKKQKLGFKLVFTLFSYSTNLDFRSNFDSFFEATKGTECSNSLSTNSLQLSKFPATAAPIFQNALSILSNLRDEHQGSGENLLQITTKTALYSIEAAFN